MITLPLSLSPLREREREGDPVADYGLHELGRRASAKDTGEKHPSRYRPSGLDRSKCLVLMSTRIGALPFAIFSKEFGGSPLPAHHNGAAGATPPRLLSTSASPPAAAGLLGADRARCAWESTLLISRGGRGAAPPRPATMLSLAVAAVERMDGGSVTETTN